jgi:hypothetical protein
VEVVHPSVVAGDRQAARDDAGSCVLRISSAAGSMLLAGDLPLAAEAALLSARRRPMKADVLVVPRQGSRTATGPLLLAAVQPAQALLQVGYRNRHRHPHPDVLGRLAQAGVRLLRTDWEGAVQLRLRAKHQPRIRRWRQDQPPYWRIATAAAANEASAATAPASRAAAASGTPAAAAGSAATAPSSRRRSARPPHGPGPPPASRGMPPVRRSAPASRTPGKAASRRPAAPSPPPR